MILYKYVRRERIDILQSGRIAFTPPELFNDPFEARPVLPDTDPKFAEVFDRITTHEDREEVINLRRTMIIRKLIVEGAPYLTGVLSLSEKRDNVLMWAHYTAEHTGFVIGFDTTPPGLLEELAKQGRKSDPIKVAYSATRPNREHLMDVTEEDLWFTKSEEWEYEAEWRYVRMIHGSQDNTINVRGTQVPLFEFPKAAVIEVILGCRADDVLEGDLKQVLSFGGYPNAKLLRATLDSTRFALNIEAVDGSSQPQRA